MKALHTITERLRAIAEEIDAGHPVDAFDIRIEATRIDMRRGSRLLANAIREARAA